MWSRRELLRRSAAALALSGPASLLLGRAPRAAEAADRAASVFPQSVASGDPTSSGAIVWTRLAPRAHDRGRDLELVVASDPDFREIVTRERIPGAKIGADADFAVRVDLDGRLAADRHFFYRFTYGGTPSRTGRLRTLPESGAEPARLRLALASCQDFTRGHFNAYLDVAREDVDYILHVGDFLYETVPPGRGLPARAITLPSGSPIAKSLEDYRTIHRAYRSDPALQRALERHTLIATWDDHDVANDRYWDATAGRLRAPDHPLDGDPAASDAVHSGGIRAWWEYLPLRAAFDATAPSPRDRLRIDRSFRFGGLAELFVSDTRLSRDPHPCGEKNANERLFKMAAKCPERAAAGRSMLGAEQRRRLVDGLAGSAAHWKLWATSVPLTPVGYGSGPGRLFLTLDGWAGYEHERRSILGDLASRGVSNLVSLTGDLHSFFTATLHAEEVDPLREAPRAVGVEIGTGALSAAPLGTFLAVMTHPDVIRENNPQIALWNAFVNGYTLIDVAPDEIRYEPRGFAVDRALERVEPQSLGKFRVRAGSTEIERA